MQKIKDFFSNFGAEKKDMLKTIAISIAVTTTIVFSIFYFDVNIGTLVEFAGPVNIDVTTTIHFN